MNTQPTQSFLQSDPYWHAVKPAPSLKEFCNSVEQFSVSFDSLYMKVMQYVCLITDKEASLSMQPDNENQLLIKHLQTLSNIFESLASDLECTTGQLETFGFFEELDSEVFDIRLLLSEKFLTLAKQKTLNV